MAIPRYTCIAESLYEDKDSWKNFGIDMVGINAVNAASNFVERYPDEADIATVFLDEIDQTEDTVILVKEPLSDNVVRVRVEVEICFRVISATRDRNYSTNTEVDAHASV